MIDSLEKSLMGILSNIHTSYNKKNKKKSFENSPLHFWQILSKLIVYIFKKKKTFEICVGVPIYKAYCYSQNPFICSGSGHLI